MPDPLHLHIAFDKYAPKLQLVWSSGLPGGILRVAAAYLQSHLRGAEICLCHATSETDEEARKGGNC